MFTLAHLSDPHLAPLPKPPSAALIGKRITGYLNWQRRRRHVHDQAILEAVVADLKAARPDHTVVTGDLANISLPDEFVRARGWLESLGPPAEVSVIPGNHDTYVAAAARAPEQHWGAYMAADSRADAAAGFPFLRRRGPVALIGLSTAVPTAPFLATGFLGSLQRERLTDLLGWLAHEDSAPFRIVMIHHPPASPAALHKRLTDSLAFRNVIRKAGAEMVIHGHDHRHMLNWLDGPDGRVPAIGVPSASSTLAAEQKRAGYNLYRIKEHGDGWRCAVESRTLRDGRMDSSTGLEFEMRRRRY